MHVTRAESVPVHGSTDLAGELGSYAHHDVCTFLLVASASEPFEKASNIFNGIPLALLIAYQKHWRQKYKH